MAAPKEDIKYTLEELKEKLTEKEKNFCHQYIIDWNGARAAREVGYSEDSAAEIGYQNLLKNHIIQYLEYIKPEYIKRKKQKNIDKCINNIGYIYLIKCKGTNYYKIGKSVNGGKQRLKTMQTGIPFDLELIVSKKCSQHAKQEKRLHELLKEYWIRGEWFVFSDWQLQKVLNLINMLSK